MNFYRGMRILVVAARPDDEVLGCDGTLAKAIAAGPEVEGSISWRGHFCALYVWPI